MFLRFHYIRKYFSSKQGYDHPNLAIEMLTELIDEDINLLI